MDIIELAKLSPESCFIKHYDVCKKGKIPVLHKPESGFGLIINGALVGCNSENRITFLGIEKDFILHDDCEIIKNSIFLSILESTTILWFKFGWQEYFGKCLQSEIRTICEQTILLHWLNTSKTLKIMQEPCAENRVLFFIKIFPDRFNKIPDKFIASFLAIQPETFSRALNKKRKNYY